MEVELTADNLLPLLRKAYSPQIWTDEEEELLLKALRSSETFAYFKHATKVVGTRSQLQVMLRAKNIKLKDPTKLTPVEAAIKERLKVLEG